jgi:two-component system phosphate regulon sensor histidine kinase PhoR
MNKKAYNTILFFTGFVLIGIIVLQIVWLNNMSAIRKKELLSNTQQALTSTVTKLEKHEEVGMVMSHMEPILPDNIDFSGLEQVNLVVNNTDSMGMINISNKRIKNSQHNYRSDQNLHEMHTHRSISFLTHKLDEKIKSIDSVVQQVIVEMNGVNTTERIHADSVKKILSAELHRYGIDIGFEYAILQKDSIIFKSDQYLPSSIAMTFDAKLFPNDIFDKNLKLVMYYPVTSSNAYLFSKMRTTLTLTGLFTLGMLIAFYLTIRIIKKQKKLGEMKNDLINNITHEFKTPIATSSIAIAALENPQVRIDQEKFDYYTGILKEENQKMNQQVEKVLQLAMMDKGKLEIALEKTDANGILQKSLNGFELLLKENQVALHLHLDAVQFRVEADPFHLEHVFNNVIDNAIKYKAENPDLTITTWNNNGRWAVRFTDNGIGMNQEVAKHAFETFYRGQVGNIHDVKGFGLGLSYAKNIIEACNGTIEISSTPKKGTAITITLPLI